MERFGIAMMDLGISLFVVFNTVTLLFISGALQRIADALELLNLDRKVNGGKNQTRDPERSI